MSDARRWLVRTRMSGVWIEVEWLGAGDLPGEYRIRGRRLYRWPKGRLACGDLARLGAPDGSRIEAQSEPHIFISDIAERHVMNAQALAQSATVASWEPS